MRDGASLRRSQPVRQTVGGQVMYSRTFGDNIAHAFRLTFLNKCDKLERPVISEFYQKAFGTELLKSSASVMFA